MYNINCKSMIRLIKKNLWISCRSLLEHYIFIFPHGQLCPPNQQQQKQPPPGKKNVYKIIVSAEKENIMELFPKYDIVCCVRGIVVVCAFLYVQFIFIFIFFRFFFSPCHTYFCSSAHVAVPSQ